MHCASLRSAYKFINTAGKAFLPGQTTKMKLNIVDFQFYSQTVGDFKNLFYCRTWV